MNRELANLDKNISELREDEVRDWSSRFIESIWNNEITEDVDSFSAIHSLEENLAHLAKDEASYNEGYITEPQRKATKIFLSTLIDFVEEQSADQEKAEELEAFLRKVQKLFFSVSPNLTNRVSLIDGLSLTTRANRTPEIQGYFGQTMAGEMVCNLSFGNYEPEYLAEKIGKLPIVEALDVIEQMKTIGIQAIANGQWAEGGMRSVESLMEELRDSNSPLIRYSAEATLERLAEEEKNPTASVLTYHGNRSAGRAVEKLPPEVAIQQDYLDELVAPDSDRSGPLSQIAPDAIAELDQSNTLQRVALISKEEIENGKNHHLFFARVNRLGDNSHLNPFNSHETKSIGLLLQRLHEPKIRALIESDLGISLRLIPLRSQIYFLQYLAEQDDSGFQRLRNALIKNKNQAKPLIISFLASAEGEDKGEAILKIAESSDQRISEIVFKKYNEIADATDAIEKYILANIPSLQASPENVSAIRKTLLRKANKLLISSADTITLDSVNSIAENLTQIRANILLFASVFKTAKDIDPSISIESFSGVSIEREKAAEVPPQEKEKMLSLYVKAREKFSEEHRTLRVKGFEELLAAPAGRFYVLRHNDDILAFVHFKDLQNGNVYGGSFTTLADVRGEKLGDALLRAALDKENETRTIEAVVEASNTALRDYYVNTLGHRLTGETVMVGDTRYLKMVREPKHSSSTLRKAA